jgi:AcrR family transcriptional regulator
MASRRIDRALVIDAAAELVDRRGAEALTLAAVATEVGVRVPSLYHHVDGLPALRTALRARALRRLHETLGEATVGRSGRDALVGVADGLRAFAHAHPGLLGFTLSIGPEDDAEAHAAGEAVVALIFAVLRGYRLDGSAAVHATRVLRAALHGFVALEAAGGFARPEDVEDSWEVLVEVLDGGLRSWREGAARGGAARGGAERGGAERGGAERGGAERGDGLRQAERGEAPEVVG